MRQYLATATIVSLLAAACGSSGSSGDSSASGGAAVPCSKAPGEACVEDIECAAPPYTFANCNNQSKCEVRQPLAHGSHGETCGATCPRDAHACFGGTDPACYASEGLYCTMKAVCKPQEAEGAPCYFADQCASGLTCINDVCAPRGVAGATCSDPSTCASELYCAQGTCVAQKPLGSDCTLQEMDPCKNGRCIAGKCVLDMSSGTTCGTSGMGPGSAGSGG